MQLQPPAVVVKNLGNALPHTLQSLQYDTQEGT